MMSQPGDSFFRTLFLKSDVMIYGLVLFICIILAAWFPITNDESYYIAYAGSPELSYIDAPPFVSYLNLIQARFGLTSPISVRAWVMVLHLFSTLFLMHIVYRHCSQDETVSRRLLLTFLMAYLVPIFGLFGLFVLPDTGLILSLSIMLWAADDVFCTQQVRWSHVWVLGLGFGIGLLSKYHILPLGAGMLLGLWVDLTLRSSHPWRSLYRLVLSGIMGLVCALPVILWNVENHYASIVFQLQHGFASDHWQVKTFILFLLGAMVYVTPWFGYVLLKRGLFFKPCWHLLIPVGSLMLILLFSSLRKSVLPHWISPAFWCLIPSTVIFSSELKSLLKLCIYTSLIWVLLLGALLLPGGLMTIKTWSMVVKPDPRMFKDLLLWQELPDLLHQNLRVHHALEAQFLQKQSPACTHSKPIIGTLRWFWASQMEYHQMFPGATILNLDQNSSNFYLWRDTWSDFANCRLVVLGGESSGVLTALGNIMTIEHEEVIHGLGDYVSMNVQLVEGTLRDAATLQKAQKSLIDHPHY
ncbi:MAG: hypothetical protein NTW94_03060 [Legionellales bacterium]|nr:hypothetical protein [Legionellales bacterium]